MNWEPSRADHSIDRATVSMVLATPLDANTFDEVIVAGRKAAAARQLMDRVDQLEAVELVAGQPIDMNSMPPRRVVFRRLDLEKVPVDELSISANRIAVGTIRYSGWKNLFDLLSSSVEALDAICSITQKVRTVRFDYVDRFLSTSETADHFEVIDRNSDFLNSCGDQQNVGASCPFRLV